MDTEIRKMLKVGEALKEICESKGIFLVPFEGFGVIQISAYNEERKDFDEYELFRSAKELAKNIMGFWMFSELCDVLPSGSPSEAEGFGAEDLICDLKFAPKEEALRIQKEYDFYLEKSRKVL